MGSVPPNVAQQLSKLQQAVADLQRDVNAAAAASSVARSKSGALASTSSQTTEEPTPLELAQLRMGVAQVRNSMRNWLRVQCAFMLVRSCGWHHCPNGQVGDGGGEDGWCSWAYGPILLCRASWQRTPCCCAHVAWTWRITMQQRSW